MDNYSMDRFGNETVTFTDAEWATMMADPSFGYVCSAGHTLTLSERTYGLDCSACEADAYAHESEAEYNEYMITGDPYAGTYSED